MELNTTKLTVELLPLPVIRAEVKIDRAREEKKGKKMMAKTGILASLVPIFFKRMFVSPFFPASPVTIQQIGKLIRLRLEAADKSIGWIYSRD